MKNFKYKIEEFFLKPLTSVSNQSNITIFQENHPLCMLNDGAMSTQKYKNSRPYNYWKTVENQ